MNDFGQEWGFNASGTPLGGTSALSMPGPRALNFHGNPLDQVTLQYSRFVKKFDKDYGKANLQGKRESFINKGDYYDNVRQVRASIKDFDAEGQRILTSGEFQVGHAAPRTVVNAAAFNGTSLSEQKARQLTAALTQYDPSVVATIALPSIEPELELVNDLGLSTPAGKRMATYLDQEVTPNSGPTMEDIQQIARSNKVNTQRVDANGVVFSKYSPGTGPYDAPGKQRAGGVKHASKGTQISGLGASLAPTSQNLSKRAAANNAPVNNITSASSGAPADDEEFVNYDPTESSTFNADSYAPTDTTDPGNVNTPQEESKMGYYLGFAGLAALGIVGLVTAVKGTEG